MSGIGLRRNVESEGLIYLVGVTRMRAQESGVKAFALVVRGVSIRSPEVELFGLSPRPVLELVRAREGSRATHFATNSSGRGGTWKRQVTCAADDEGGGQSKVLRSTARALESKSANIAVAKLRKDIKSSVNFQVALSELVKHSDAYTSSSR